jgi:hypothetical protein
LVERKTRSRFKGNPYSTVEYDDLVATLHNKTKAVPPIISMHTKQKSINNNSSKLGLIDDEVKIIGIIKDEISSPKNDGTRGSALYAVPFILNRAPSLAWRDLFIQAWKHPSRFTTMYRSNIASVSGNKIILNGTTLDEVIDYHHDTLLLAVNDANAKEKQYIIFLSIVRQ